MTELIKLPYLGTAEEDVLFVEWFVEEGGSFHKGATLAVVETLKAAFEVEAERDGVLLRRLVSEGMRVPVKAPIGVVGDEDEPIDEARLAELLAEIETAAPAEEAELAAAPKVTGKDAGFSIAAAPAARRLAAERGIDLATVSGSGPNGLIRVADVERALSEGTGTPAAAADGVLDAAFLEHLRSEGEAFAALSSDFKLDLYRRHGALIGEGAQLGRGSLILAERIVLGDGCFVGDGCRIEAEELEAGNLLRLGHRTSARCRRLRFGTNAFFAEDVEIGGGGAMDPEAELVVGSHGFVGEHVHLNPCRPLVIGDEVVISRNAVLMTHSFGGSILRGFPNRFRGITLGDCCQVGIHATLFPGVEMGEGSILLSGSSLVSSVPAGRLFGGVPAQDLKPATSALGPEDLAALARDLMLEFARQLELRGFEIETGEADDELRIAVRVDGLDHLLRFSAGALDECSVTAAEELRVSCGFEDADWEDQPAEVTAIDLARPAIRGPHGPLGDALREFLRKRGVRLHPRAWTYRGGWL